MRITKWLWCNHTDDCGGMDCDHMYPHTLDSDDVLGKCTELECTQYDDAKCVPYPIVDVKVGKLKEGGGLYHKDSAIDTMIEEAEVELQKTYPDAKITQMRYDVKTRTVRMVYTTLYIDEAEDEVRQC